MKSVRCPVLVCCLLAVMSNCAAQPGMAYTENGFAWKESIAIDIHNSSDVAREHELVILSLSSLGAPDDVRRNAMRLVTIDGAVMRSLPFQINEDKLSFLTSLSPGETEHLRLFYTRDANAPKKDYMTLASPSFDVSTGELSNGIITIMLPTPGSERSDMSIRLRDKQVVPNIWLYFLGKEYQNFRTTGPARQIKTVLGGPLRCGVLLQCEPDIEAMRGRYHFEIYLELCAFQKNVFLKVKTIPRERCILRAETFVSAFKPDPKRDLFFSVGGDGMVRSIPASGNEPYGRRAFDKRNPFLLLFNPVEKLGVAVTSPAEDLMYFKYACDFSRFELSRSAACIRPDIPLVYCTQIAVGSDPKELISLYQASCAPLEITVMGKHIEPVSRTVWNKQLHDDPVAPPNVLSSGLPRVFSPGIQETNEGVEVSTRTLKLLVNNSTGAVTSIRSASGDVGLLSGGGVCLTDWQEKSKLGPVGETSDWKTGAEKMSFTWKKNALVCHNEVTYHDSYIEWASEVENQGDRKRLLQTHFSLPLDLGNEDWYFWNGAFVNRVNKDSTQQEFTTLWPGNRLSQGIFPVVSLSNKKVGLAIGLHPMDIYSFYGAECNPRGKPDEGFNYLLRIVIPPSEKRRVRFLIFAIDPEWGWRSCINEYYKLFPDVFAAPQRQDVWGLYGSSSPRFIDYHGDKYIDYCRRYRIGAMELYGPFTKTGEFYPQSEPVYARGKEGTRLNREQMKRVFEIANIASCNISYLIPTKCNRDLALERYRDSIIKQKDGEFFLSDRWCVIGDWIGGGKEKLAAMFAAHDSFGENLQNNIRDIIKNYAPDGFYFDNGAFIWEDYGRELAYSSFDDDGQVYTNAGVAYAEVQDFVKRTAPHVHRNPGEFIQYFSGFRGQSHLTNCITTQINYIRSHRFIMGRKPIYVGHPRNYHEKRDLNKSLIWGGLPWLSTPREKANQNIALVKTAAEISVALAKAGWQPLTGAVVDNGNIRVERFGEVLDTYLVLVNTCAAEQWTTLIVNNDLLRAQGLLIFGDFAERTPVQNEILTADKLTKLTVGLPPDGAVVLRACALLRGASASISANSRRRGEVLQFTLASETPQELVLIPRALPGMCLTHKSGGLNVSVKERAAVEARLQPLIHFSPSWKAVQEVSLLSGAHDVTIILPKAASVEEYQNARRIKGFVEFQAELLQKDKPPEIEIRKGLSRQRSNGVTLGLSSHDEIAMLLPRANITPAEMGGDQGVVAALSDAGLLIAAGGEEALTRAVWKYLDAIEAPFPGQQEGAVEFDMPLAEKAQ